MDSNINYSINRMKALMYARLGKESDNLPERIEATLDIKDRKSSCNLIEESCKGLIEEIDKLIDNLNSNTDKELINCMKSVKGQLGIKMYV